VRSVSKRHVGGNFEIEVQNGTKGRLKNVSGTALAAKEYKKRLL